MSIQTRGVVPGLYDNVDKTVVGLVGKELKELQKTWTKLFRTESSDKKFERFMSMAPFGDIPEKAEGADYTFDLIEQGYTKDVTPIEFGMGFKLTETADEDDQFGELKKYAKYLAFSARTVQRKYAAKVFNNGFSSQKTADAVALFSTSHTIKRGGTVQNKPSSDADLSIDALMQAFVDLNTNLKSEAGQIMEPATEYYLYVAPANEFTALQITKSSGLPDTALNDINPVKASRTIEVVVDPHLTDSDAWFLVPKSKDRHGLIHLDRVGITMGRPMDDADTGSRVYKLRFRQTWDSLWHQGVYGSSGA